MKTALHLVFAFLILSIVTTAAKDEKPAPPPEPEPDSLSALCCSDCRAAGIPPFTCVFVYHCNAGC